MRAVVQRVSMASVRVEGECVAGITKGFLVLLGVEEGDTAREAAMLAEKIARLRIFPDDHKPMNVDLLAADGAVLVVSQFTLAADVSKGNRPSFIRAAAPEEAERLYLLFADTVEAAGIRTLTGTFGADMKVEIVNDGPVTIIVSVPPGGRVAN